MIRRLLDRVATPPTAQTVPRGFFLTLIILIGLFVAIDLVTWTRGGGADLRRLIGSVGILLLMVFFYSRQRQVRLFCYFCGMACLLYRIAGDLRHLLPT